VLPKVITERTDKMGFPTPLNEWLAGPAKEFVSDLFSSQAALSREFVDNRKVGGKIATESKFGRNLWGLLCLELWQREFHDRASQFRSLLD
jgi:asparagine synthase (glutamine-hydrolysing)